MTGADRFRRLENYFHELVDLDREQQAARLSDIGAAEPDLHAELLSMLAATRAGLRAPEAALQELASAVVGSDSARPEAVGPYRIVGLLGQGGMGQVFEAEQNEPVRRSVALKIARGTLLSDSARARFRAERQALAVLDHPNISKVFDAGSTQSGQLWFAMELVRGLPITRWAEERGLGLEQRIKLFLPVCEAVHHAHQKGLIHRDLKPSNLLVVDDGGIGQPRVIDFGVAKVLDEVEGREPFATRVGEAVGTPEYMSPEQASLGEMDIDTRSDVYALGLVLYQLLTGRLPINPETLGGASFGELCRRVRYDPIVAPSRVPEQGPFPVARRALRGDLDLVLLKALAKDREQRYDSAAALAEDLRRVLTQQPVMAAPPRLSYRLDKFVRRNRLPVAAAAVVTLGLLLSVILAGLGLMEARRAESKALMAADQAEQQRQVSDEVTRFMVNLFRAADPVQEPGLEATAADLLLRGEQRIEELAAQPAVQAELLAALGGTYFGLGDSARAEPLLRRALDLRSGGAAADAYKQAAASNRLADLLLHVGRSDEAEALYRQSLALLDELGKLDASDEIVLRNGLGRALLSLGRTAEAEQVFEEALALADSLPDQRAENGIDRNTHRLNLLSSLASLYGARGEFGEAARMTQALLELLPDILPDAHPNFAVLHNNLSVLLGRTGDLAGSLEHALISVERSRQSLGHDHPRTAAHLLNLGSVQWRLGDPAAAGNLEEAIGIYELKASKQYNERARALFRLAQVKALIGEKAEAAARGEQALDLVSRYPAAASPDERAMLYVRLSLLADGADPIDVQDYMARAKSMETELTKDARARLLLTEALYAARQQDYEKARSGLLEAERLTACGQAGCLLDNSDEGVVRAQVLALLGEHERAVLSLQHAIQHPGWTAWLLDLPDLLPLQADAGWASLQSTLATRVPPRD